LYNGNAKGAKFGLDSEILCDLLVLKNVVEGSEAAQSPQAARLEPSFFELDLRIRPAIDRG
jgi:hypothetical protein